jgi:pyruvate/2-oxoglutarate/acetoin dehydrogenase E1 component
MERRITFKQAINEALAQEMERDKDRCAHGRRCCRRKRRRQMDAWGGVPEVTKGLWEKFGDRVMDTLISESAFVGGRDWCSDIRDAPGRRADVGRIYGAVFRSDL